MDKDSNARVDIVLLASSPDDITNGGKGLCFYGKEKKGILQCALKLNQKGRAGRNRNDGYSEKSVKVKGFQAYVLDCFWL